MDINEIEFLKWCKKQNIQYYNIKIGNVEIGERGIIATSITFII